MTSIRVLAGNRKIDLDPTQVGLFTRELKRVKKGPSSKGVVFGVQPECTISVKSGNSRRDYRLYARAVLHDIKSKRNWQFYFGLLILEWIGLAP